MSPPTITQSKPSKPTARPRHFAVVPVKVQDIRRLVDIEFHAFENEQVNQVLSYRDYKKPAHFERSVKLYTETMQEEDVGVPHNRRDESAVPFSKCSMRKIVDVDTGDIVSFTKLEMKAYSAEELGRPFDIGHEGEPEMNRDWFGLNERLKREYVGSDPHCCE